MQLAGLAAVLLSAACAETTAEREVVVSACDSAAHVPPGGTLVVRLESQFTTGYLWGVAAPSPRVVEAVGKPTTEPQKEDEDGGTQRQVFRFKAVSTGSGTLTFHKKRSWEKGKPPLETCTIKVEVAE